MAGVKGTRVSQMRKSRRREITIIYLNISCVILAFYQLSIDMIAVQPSCTAQLPSLPTHVTRHDFTNKPVVAADTIRLHFT